jgi:hypothetical protein
MLHLKQMAGSVIMLPVRNEGNYADAQYASGDVWVAWLKAKV